MKNSNISNHCKMGFFFFTWGGVKASPVIDIRAVNIFAQILLATFTVVQGTWLLQNLNQFDSWDFGANLAIFYCGLRSAVEHMHRQIYAPECWFSPQSSVLFIIVNYICPRKWQTLYLNSTHSSGITKEVPAYTYVGYLLFSFWISSHRQQELFG